MTHRILFRYHRDFPVCIQNLKALRKLNPDLPIDGMFGGNPTDFQNIPQELIALLDSNWCLPIDDPYYKWKNGDLCVRWWYRDFGQKFPFTHLYLLEWDLYTLKPLKDIYPALEPETNYGSFFGDYAHTVRINWWWITGQFAEEVDDLRKHLERSGYHFNLKNLNYGIMGGTVFCRAFLDRFSSEPVPGYSNDELRLSVYSNAYQIPLRDNGQYLNPKNLMDAEDKIFTQSDLDQVKEMDGNLIHPLRFIIKDGKAN